MPRSEKYVGERKEWFRLADDMRMLARIYDADLGADLWREIDLYTLAIECIDRKLDAIEFEVARREFVKDVETCLHGEPTGLPKELAGKLLALRPLLLSRGVTSAFCEKLKETLTLSEEIRKARSRRDYVRKTLAEGRRASELLVIMLHGAVPERFASFLVDVGGPANLLDNLRDARRDYAEGALRLRPGLRLHFALAASLVGTGLWTVLHSPAPLRLTKWGLSELVRPIAAS